MLASSFTSTMKKELAIEFLHRCVTQHGFVASPIQQDNYHRIWSRDAVIMGLSAALSGDHTLLLALKESILTLGNHQANNGQIPSNVDFKTNKASYGTLVGRVDATTWWIIGACICIQNDASLLEKLKSKIEKAFEVLQTWEMNQRGLIYTPMGGNWADEYVTEGYVLYDQLLRLWAFQAYSKLDNNRNWEEKSLSLKKWIAVNYNLNEDANQRYHEVAFQKVHKKPMHWPAALQASGYDIRWDMSANALALLLKLPFDNDSMVSFLAARNQEFNHHLFPVFYPIIHPTDWEWRLLESNHLYAFKNQPHCFHNGGAWPVFLGLLSLGLSANGYGEYAEKIWIDFEAHVHRFPEYPFTEYWNTKQGTPGGVQELGFSAAGIIFMEFARDNNYDLKAIML